LEKAAEHKISGVTYQLTMGVVKNIIPAIASTNAIIAAACANEAFKIMTGCSKKLENYMMFMGNEGIFTNTFAFEPKTHCLVCSALKPRNISLAKSSTFGKFIEFLKTDPGYELSRPSVANIAGNMVYLNNPGFESLYAPNLAFTLEELVEKGEMEDNPTLIITDAKIPTHIKFRVTLT